MSRAAAWLLAVCLSTKLSVRLFVCPVTRFPLLSGPPTLIDIHQIFTKCSAVGAQRGIAIAQYIRERPKSCGDLVVARTVTGHSEGTGKPVGRTGFVGERETRGHGLIAKTLEC